MLKSNKGNISVTLVGATLCLVFLVTGLRAFPQMQKVKVAMQLKLETTDILNDKLEQLMNLSAAAPDLTETISLGVPHKKNGLQWDVQFFPGSRLKKITLRAEKQKFGNDVSVIGYRYDDF